MKTVVQQIQHCRESKETVEQNIIIIIIIIIINKGDWDYFKDI